jgi:GntR family transcriptional regulator
VRKILDVDPSASTPIWRQIENGMRRLVASGGLPAGAPVPSVRELAKVLRVNPATVSKAYRRLTDAGLLTVRRGEGTYVGDLSRNECEVEQRRLLEEGASEYIRIATSVGLGRDTALRLVRNRWPDRVLEGDEGVDSE